MSKPSQQIVLEQLACFVVLTYVGVMIVNNWYFQVVPNKWWLNDWHPPKTNTSCFFREWEIAPVILKFYFGNSMVQWSVLCVTALSNLHDKCEGGGAEWGREGCECLSSDDPSWSPLKEVNQSSPLVSSTCLIGSGSSFSPQLVAQVDFRWFYLFRTNSQ